MQGNRLVYLRGCVALIAVLSLSMPVMGDDQRRVAREMVQVLEAYAVYKMGLYDEAYERYLALAENGNVQGMLNVAGMYAEGKGTPEDHGKALQWRQRAADGGNATAMYEVARAYDQGLGTEANPAKAEAWYRRAALQGDELAQQLLKERSAAQR